MVEMLDEKPFENIIDSELEEYIKELAGYHEIAVVLSSNYDKIKGFCSTYHPDDSNGIYDLKYRGETINTKDIAVEISTENFESVKEKFWPYFLYKSMNPTDSCYLFNLLVAIDIPEILLDNMEPNAEEIRHAIENRWMDVHGYHLKLFLKPYNKE